MKPIILAIAEALSLAVPAQAEHLYPRNECRQMPGAQDFQRKLVTAVANRDEALLKALVDENITLDFGGGFGWEEMRKRLDSSDYKLWEELDKVTRLGCAKMGPEELALPWIWGQDLGFEDPFSTMVVMGNDVPLLAEPRAEATRLKTLRWEAVSLLPSEDYDAKFVPIQTRSGEKGFAEFARLRSEIDYRLLAMKRDERWVITHFIAGD